MGVDTLPSRRNATVDRNVSRAQMLVPNIAKKHMESTKIDCNSPTSAALKQTKCTLLSYNMKRDNFHKGKYIQIAAQENLNKVKMAGYIDPKRNLAPKENFWNDKQCENDSQDGDHKRFEEEEDNVDSSPTRIVILMPSFERKVDVEPRLGSSENLEEDCSMRGFLEEVKECVKIEVQGNPTIRATKRGNRPETLHTPRQIALDLAKLVRESVVRDIGMKLTRSESMRSSYKSDSLTNGPDSPVIAKGDDKNILLEKFKNVFANEVSEASHMIKSRARLKSMPDLSNIKWKEKRTASESASEHKKDNILLFNSVAASPRNLVRSFQKPFLEDSQIEKRHEASTSPPKDTKKNSKDCFSITSRVSNLKQNFTLKGKLLFGKKTHSSKKKPTGSEFGSMNIIRTIPSAIMNAGITRENNTEVPPSPVSVSRSVRDEICTSENPGPVSPLEVHVTENQPSPPPRFSKDSSCILPELSQLDQVENNKPEVLAAEQEASDNDIVEIESHEQAYVKSILVAAGLYENRSVDQANARRKILISNKLFDEVEKSYSRYSKVDNEDSFLHHGNITIGHKLLFDLVNEALSSVSDTPKDSSTFRKWVVGRSTVPHGKRLFDDVWDQIQIYGDRQTDEMRAINSMLARDVRVATSAATLYESIDASLKKIECAILGELIDDVVKDMLL